MTKAKKVFERKSSKRIVAPKEDLKPSKKVTRLNIKSTTETKKSKDTKQANDNKKSENETNILKNRKVTDIIEKEEEIVINKTMKSPSPQKNNLSDKKKLKKKNVKKEKVIADVPEQIFVLKEPISPVLGDNNGAAVTIKRQIPTYVRNPWTQEETKALEEGVLIHGVGNWLHILVDPNFENILKNRTNIDLKDKYRLIARKQAKLAQANL